MQHMPISVFELFSIGIGPSSSHTVGPMRATFKFVQDLENKGFLQSLSRLKVDLYGSLALTGKGHGTDIAILLGSEGYTPAGIDPDQIKDLIAKIRNSKTLDVAGKYTICFHEEKDLLFHGDKQLPFHPNGIRFTAYDKEQKELYSDVMYSVGGGFIIDHASTLKNAEFKEDEIKVPYPFDTADQLLEQCTKANMTIAELVMENEKAWRSPLEIKNGLLNIWHVMQACIERGCQVEGILPGGLNVKRRAAPLYKALTNPDRKKNPAELMEWVSLWALAVNEENAAGGRVVTAPTNGAAGVIPSVINYYLNMTENPSDDGIVTFMLVAGAMGILFKKGASISAAEMGCMGEVGVACSMAAGGLTAALGGSNRQVENATEIGMEHNLGLTCDPIMGLVQIPCIERNTMGAVTAINSMLLAMQGDGTHRVSLDQVIATMLQTGRDMQTIYKETSLGGLAVNVPEC
jgi:L-serine dehydratase